MQNMLRDGRTLSGSGSFNILAQTTDIFAQLSVNALLGDLKEPGTPLVSLFLQVNVFLVELLQGPNRPNQYQVANSEMIDSVNRTMHIFVNEIGLSATGEVDASVALTASKVRSALTILTSAIFEGHVHHDIANTIMAKLDIQIVLKCVVLRMASFLRCRQHRKGFVHGPGPQKKVEADVIGNVMKDMGLEAIELRRSMESSTDRELESFDQQAQLPGLAGADDVLEKEKEALMWRNLSKLDHEDPAHLELLEQLEQEGFDLYFTIDSLSRHEPGTDGHFSSTLRTLTSLSKQELFQVAKMRDSADW